MVQDWKWREQGQMEQASVTVNLWPWKGWTWERFSFISCKYRWAAPQPERWSVPQNLLQSQFRIRQLAVETTVNRCTYKATLCSSTTTLHVPSLSPCVYSLNLVWHWRFVLCNVWCTVTLQWGVYYSFKASWSINRPILASQICNIESLLNVW